MAAQSLNPKQIAKNFIKPYVERGSADSFLRDMGYLGNGIGVYIGGYCGGKRITNEQIAVEIDDKVSIFSKKELIEELKSPQMSLL